MAPTVVGLTGSFELSRRTSSLEHKRRARRTRRSSAHPAQVNGWLHDELAIASCNSVASVELRVMTEPQQGGTYDEILRVARMSEELGFDAFFRSDHLQRIGSGDRRSGSTEAWATLAGLARETSRIRLGTMVTSATFRRPGMLALTVATVDAMSGGRVELGLGTGWFEGEHLSYGIPFPPVSERFDVLEEQLEAITGLWKTAPGDSFSYHGRHVVLEDNPALPKPVQPGGVPIIIGGAGATRTPRLAALYASEFNMPPGQSVEAAKRQFARVRDACEQAGREPASLVLSSVQSLDADVSELIDRLARLAELGSTRTYLQLDNLTDVHLVERFAVEGRPQLNGA
jgi:F420-dependent oxidoreductase-like protein